MRLRRLLAAVLAVVLAGAWAGAARAQTTEGTIVGTVKDPQGAVVPGAKVTATNPATGLVRTATASPDGMFRIPALPAGVYRVEVEASGFSKAVVESVNVAVDQVQSVVVPLRLAAGAQTVTVSAAVEQVNTQTTQLGGVVQQEQVTTLPLNGRNFAQLAALVPGVAAFGGGGGQQGGEGGVSGFASNGHRSSANNFMVDGISNNNYVGGSVMQLPSIDSVQEFEVQTDAFAPEFGRNSGAIVNLVTKSGTNDFHGNVYEFLRNDALDARNFFANPNLAQPKLRLNQFGFTLGGPVVKDHTFFFANYEGFRQRAGITKLTNVPTDAQRNGFFPNAQGQIVQVPVNPVSAQLFKLFPEPNTTQTGGNFVSSPNLSNNTDQGLLKIDHRFSPTDTLSARYSLTETAIVAPFAPGQEVTSVPGFGILTDATNHLGSFAYTRTFGANVLNEFRFGFTRVTALSSNQPGPQAAAYGFNTGWPAGAPHGLGNIPDIVFSGGFVSNGGSISNLGGTDNNPAGNWQNTLEWIDNLSYTRGAHNLKFGFDIQNIRANRLYDLAQSGQIQFGGGQNPQGIANPLADFAAGLPSGSLHFVGDSARSFRTTYFGMFAQDSFEVRPSLTFDYGLRYEIQTVLHDATNRIATFVPSLFQTFLSPSADQTNLAVLEASGMRTQGQLGTIYQPDYKSVAPRLGFAWALGPRQQSVVRAAYGIFYDTILGNIPSNIMLNPPYLPGFFVTPPFIQWPQSFAPSGFPVLTFPDRHYPSPYSQDWNLNVQHELPAQILFQIGYVGSKGTHLARFVQVDQAFNTPQQIAALTPDVVTRMELMGIPPPAAKFLSQHIALIPSVARTPFFGYAQLFQAQNSINSIYHGLETSLKKTARNGSTFLLSYTFSKSIDGASVFFGSGANGTTIFPQNNYNLAAERGRSDFDVRHRFVLSYIYQVPTLRGLMPRLAHPLADGWAAAGIVTLQSGQPFSVLTGANRSSTGLGTDRPDLVGDPNAGPHTVDRWFNTSAFVLNAPLAFGNAGRNIATGPGFRNVDFSVIKDTRLTERARLEFRAEFFNIFNHPNFGLPNSVMSSPTFGSLFQTADVAQNNVGLGSGGPRLIQFGLKLGF
ncbi:MAG TPA: carboxypeptidase regulatory-like domain-containing protein [Candidatus Acidoferrales bacterium]|nr:carboxypeptidase regulatory-like domain-containing protein [Candidatus Acidoferrales bacterium]